MADKKCLLYLLYILKFHQGYSKDFFLSYYRQSTRVESFTCQLHQTLMKLVNCRLEKINFFTTLLHIVMNRVGKSFIFLLKNNQKCNSVL